MKKTFVMLSVLSLEAYLLLGCTTTTPPVEPTIPNNANAAAVCIGLTQVDPNGYQGWNGDCPGCDIDAKGMYSLFTKNGITSALMLNKDATWQNVKSTIMDVCCNMDLKCGDLLIITMSGHGGQVPDISGDELSDGMDETIIFYDSAVIDDDILTFLRTLPTGLRICLINDQCHSQGNFRSAINKITFGKLGKKKGRLLIKKGEMDVQLIQFAGCREADYSYGSSIGGSWTRALLAVFKDTMSWKQWFDEAAKRMSSQQIPAYSEFGNVTEQFRNGKVLK